MAVLPFIVLFLTFLVGLTIGSFLNVVIMRSVSSSPLTGRSHCDTCSTVLSWRELIPIISFAYQKGRCLHCGAVLSVQYPLVEFGTGLVFAAIGGQAFSEAFIVGDIALFFITCAFLIAAAAMIVIAVADVNYHIIPNGAVLILFVFGIAATAVRNGLICVSSYALCTPASFNGIVWDFAASIGAIFLFFALWYLSKGKALGFGDVKLVGATSLAVGFPLSAVAVVFAFWLGGLAGIVMLAARLRGLKSEIAFGPFIIAGTLEAFFFGHSFLVASGFKYLL